MVQCRMTASDPFRTVSGYSDQACFASTLLGEIVSLLRASIIAVAFLVLAVPALAAPQIWEYAFLTRTDEPVAGYGAAVFNEDKGFRVGPVRTAEGHTFVVAFQYEETEANGLFAPEGKLDEQVQLAGTLSRTYSRELDGCLVQVRLSDGTTEILLERVDDSCSED